MIYYRGKLDYSKEQWAYSKSIKYIGEDVYLFLDNKDFWIRIDPKTLGIYANIDYINGEKMFQGDIIITEQLDPCLDVDTWTREECGTAVVEFSINGGISVIDRDVSNKEGFVNCWDTWNEESIHSIKYLKRIGTIHDKEPK